MATAPIGQDRCISFVQKFSKVRDSSFRGDSRRYRLWLDLLPAALFLEK
jgi:hypothetical protein